MEFNCADHNNSTLVIGGFINDRRIKVMEFRLIVVVTLIMDAQVLEG